MTTTRPGAPRVGQSGWDLARPVPVTSPPAGEVTCPHPHACGEHTHVAGSAMAAACPGAPVVAVLEAAFAAAGSRALGRPAAGGYDRVEVSDLSDGGLRVEYRRGEQVHRGDGPAVIDLDVSGAPTTWVWARGGDLHRCSGPARFSREEGGSHHLALAPSVAGHGSAHLMRSTPLGRADDPATRSRLAGAAAAGAHPAHPVCWSTKDPESVAALAPLTACAVTVDELMAQGVTGTDDLAAVLTGAAPASWAGTGS